jgi:hypothetical protein
MKNRDFHHLSCENLNRIEGMLVFPLLFLRSIAVSLTLPFIVDRMKHAREARLSGLGLPARQKAIRQLLACYQETNAQSEMRSNQRQTTAVRIDT